MVSVPTGNLTFLSLQFNLAMLLRKPGQSSLHFCVALPCVHEADHNLPYFTLSSGYGDTLSGCLLQDLILPFSFIRPTFSMDLSIGDRVFCTRSNDDEDVVGDDGDVCALCCIKSDLEKMSMCDK